MARVVSGAQARALLTMAEAIEVNASAFQHFHRGRTETPDRIIVRGACVWNVHEFFTLPARPPDGGFSARHRHHRTHLV